MNKKLHEMRCAGYEGDLPALNSTEINQLMPEIPHWQINAQHTVISRRFEFKGFYQTMAFVNAVAWVANQENHHPDMEVGYDYCVVKFTTHAIHGLTQNDFICAAKINQLEVA